MIVRPFAHTRILVGLAALFAPRPAARLAGFPAEHDNATGRTIGRLFGVRDVALGALALGFADDPRTSRRLHRVLACVDAGDAAAAAWALGRREGIDRAALGLLAIASSAAAAGVFIARAEDERAIREVIDE